MKWIEFLRKDNYALLQSESDTQYAVVSGYDPTQPEDQQWAQIVLMRIKKWIFHKKGW